MWKDGIMNSHEKTHSLTLNGRSRLCISGVSELIAFDEESVILDMSGTQLDIGGFGLTVTRLSLETGEVDLSGRVDSIIYAEDTPKSKPLFSRLLFRQ